MIQFQENAQTDERTDRMTEEQTVGWTDPILQAPSGYNRGSKKLPISKGDNAYLARNRKI